MTDGKVNEDICRVGNNVPMMDSEGNPLNGTIIEISDNDVRMDFNHPMAGESLHFTGEVTDIREATEEELQHGHIHESCGCSGGGCGDGSCSDKGEGGCGCKCPGWQKETELKPRKPQQIRHWLQDHQKTA
jgi:FKBP-type peptidyl-prolyl cis-trans isomerase SlyD